MATDDKPKIVITPDTLRDLQNLGKADLIPADLPVQDPAELDTDDETILVCATKGTRTPFTDNLDGVCAKCGTEIFFRPHVPKNAIRMCIRCAMIRVGQEAAQ